MNNDRELWDELYGKRDSHDKAADEARGMSIAQTRTCCRQTCLVLIYLNNTPFVANYCSLCGRPLR